MADVCVNGTVTSAPRGSLLSELLGQNLSMPCGGKGRCGKCRVRAVGMLSPLTAEEKGALSPKEIEDGVRLACCARVEGDVTVETGPSPSVSQICAEGGGVWDGADPIFKVLGAAVDIGTTTLAAQLYSRDGLLATAAAPNPQASFGADVITRVGSAMAGNGADLAQCVLERVSEMLQTMCREAGRTTERIDGLVVTGNTAMLHLFAGDDPSPWRRRRLSPGSCTARPFPQPSWTCPVPRMPWSICPGACPPLWAPILPRR